MKTTNKFDKPTFKLSRESILKAIYGDLSEDAANIAGEELEKKWIDYIKSQIGTENDYDPKGSFSAQVLSSVCDYATTTEELVFLCFKIGCAIEAFNSPLRQIEKILTTK